MATPQEAAPAAAVQVKRTFAAPREKVFEAWIKPQMMTKWFARSAQMEPGKVIEADARAGGKYLIEVTCKDETVDKLYRIQGTYREVRSPERLVFTWWWEGADFQPSLITVEFRALGQSQFTEVTLTHELLPEKEREGHRTGWMGCFDMLEKALAEPS